MHILYTQNMSHGGHTAMRTHGHMYHNFKTAEIWQHVRYHAISSEFVSLQKKKAQIIWNPILFLKEKQCNRYPYDEWLLHYPLLIIIYNINFPTSCCPTTKLLAEDGKYWKRDQRIDIISVRCSLLKSAVRSKGLPQAHLKSLH